MMDTRHAALAIGANIRAARVKQKWTQRHLAKRIGSSYVHLCMIERGRKLPSIPKLLLIAEAVGVKPGTLFRE